MKVWSKRLLSVTLLLTALLVAAVPGALADYGVDPGDFDDDMWRMFFDGELTKCPECDLYTEDEHCDECGMCWDCTMDSTEHCPSCSMHGWDEDTWCESCGCAPCCEPFEIAEELGYGLGTLCDFCIEENKLDFDICQICLAMFDEMSENEYCMDCFICDNCWDQSEHCRFCGQENDMCDSCSEQVCVDCHESSDWYCDVCNKSCVLDKSATGCPADGEHCFANCCQGEWICTVCGECFFEDQSDYCEECNHCIDCGIDEYRHCAACAECYDGSTAPCGDFTYCIDCCPSETDEHCYNCGEHTGPDGDNDWCDDGGEGTHCIPCTEWYCDYCSVCFECEAGVECDYCGLCEECCKSNSEDRGCDCGMCVEDGDFEEHLSCPECEFNLCEEGVELCSECELCPECCEANSESEGCACGMCVMDSDFEDHLSCPDCDYNLCESGDELCSECNLCPECCAANAEAEGCSCGMCVEESEFEDHLYCPDCGKTMCDSGEEFCDWCELCEECCEVNSTDAGCVCGMCVEEIGFDKHVTCKGCDDGLCASGEEPCFYCGMCVNCCTANQCEHGVCFANVYEMRAHTCEQCGTCFDEDELCGTCADNYDVLCTECCAAQSALTGCGHGVCLNDADAWINHWCYECNVCEGECGHTLPYGEHPVNPSRHYESDLDTHWRSCRYCDSPAHRTEVGAHRYVRGECWSCGIQENAGMAPYIISQDDMKSVTQPNPGEDRVKTKIKVYGGCLTDFNISWELLVGGEWQESIQDDELKIENNTFEATTYPSVPYDACLKADQDGVYAQYRLHVWNEYGEAYSDPIKVKIRHNALGYTYLRETDQGYENKAKSYSGMHWPCCSLCGEGEKIGDAEMHVGKWKSVAGTDNYTRTCDLCGAVEVQHKDKVSFDKSPENATVEIPAPGEPNEYAVFTVYDTTSPLNGAANKYYWFYSFDSKEWVEIDSDEMSGIPGVRFSGFHSTEELTVAVTSEATCGNSKLYFRCEASNNGQWSVSNQAILRIECNQKDYDFFTQKENNAVTSHGKEYLMDMHWPVCSGCGGNADTEAREAHQLGSKIYDAEKGLHYQVCRTCGYEEWEYAEDEFHFSVQPKSMHITGAEKGDTVTLTAKATGTDEEIYYMWVRAWPYHAGEGKYFMSWDCVQSGFGKNTLKISVDGIACGEEKVASYQDMYMCLARAGEEIDEESRNWKEGAIASNFAQLFVDHNQSGVNYDELYHWPCCDLCGKNDIYEESEPHTMSDWHVVSSENGTFTFERSCECGYTQSTAAKGSIEYAEISDIMRPVPGGTPDFYGTLNSYSTRSFEIKWYELDAEGNKILPGLAAQDTFKDDTVYRVEAILNADAGYGYSVNSNARINGENAGVYGPTEGAGVVALYIDYNTADCITFVDIYDIIQPIADTSIDYTAELGTSDSSIMPLNGNDVAWYYTYDGSSEYSLWPKEWTISPDYSYRAVMLLQAEEGKYFAVDPSGNAVVNAKINAKSAKVTVEDSMTYGKVRYIEVSYDFGKPQRTKGVLITGHEVTNGQWLGNNGHVYNGTPSGNGWAWYKDGKLTLNNFSDSAGSGVRGIVIYRPLTIELIGKNSLTVEDYASGISVAGNLVIEGSGSLTLNAGKAGINVNEGSLIMNDGMVTVNAGNEALYIGNHNDSSKTLVLNGGYLKLTSNKYEGLYMLSWMDGYRTPIRVNGGSLIMSSPNYATNVWALEGLATVMAGTCDSDVVVLDDIGMMSTYPYVKIAHDKQAAFYVVEQPVDLTTICGPDSIGTVNFRINGDDVEYLWYLDVGDGNGFRTALEQADSGKAALGGWDDPELSVNALITSAKAYCVATAGPETFTSNIVTITLEHDYTGFISTGDPDTHEAYCQRCFEKYPHEHARVYKITSEATTTTAGSYRYDCALCGYASESKGYSNSMLQRTTTLTLDWNDGLGTVDTVSVEYIGKSAISVVPTREGHIFKGWAVLPNATEPDYTDTVSVVRANPKLYAVWKPYDYTISGWVTSNGTAENPVTVKIDLYKLGTDEVTGEETETLHQSIEVVNDDASMAERYTFEMLWPGEYRIRAAADGYEEIVGDITISDYSQTMDLRMVRPDITRMDFRVENLKANNYVAGIKVTTDTDGIMVNELYGAGGYQLYSDSDGYVGDALLSGKIEGGKFYWVRVDYTVDEEYSIDWNNYTHVMNGSVSYSHMDSYTGEYAYFRMYVPANGAEATGSLNISCYSTPEPFGYADEYPYFGYDSNMACGIVEQKWMKGDAQFIGAFEQGETYTLYAAVQMNDGSKFPTGVYVTVNGETPTSVRADGNLLIVTKDYKVDSLLTFKLPAALKAIEAEAFEGSTAEAFEIPEGCTSIGSRAFANCPNLKVLIIRSSSITIADDALAGNFEATGACSITIISPAKTDAHIWAMEHGVNWQPLN